MSRLRVRTLKPDEFGKLAVEAGFLGEWPSFAAYERWKRGLGILRIHWASPGKTVYFLGVAKGRDILAAARLSAVPFYERRHWGKEGDRRGEVQDLILRTRDSAPLAKLLEEASIRLRALGIEALGVSAWDSTHWELLENVGLRPYARSVLLVWDTASSLAKSPNEKVRIEPWDLTMGTGILRRIQRSSWGFFIPPESSVQEVLVAWLAGEPVGSVYVNRITGNLDFGVHVVREHWRRRIGTALVEAARRLCLAQGKSRMSVVRVLRALGSFNPHDRRALCFYQATGARLKWEVRGFRYKKRATSISLPPLSSLDCDAAQRKK